MENRLTRILGIEIPLIQAPMAGVSTPAMAAAVTNAGGLGSISVGAVTADKAAADIAALRQATNGSFNVNVFVHEPTDADPEREAAWIDTLSPYFTEFGADAPKGLREIYKSFKADDEMLAALCEAAPPIVSFHFGLPHAGRIAALKAAGVTLLASATTAEEARAVEAAGCDAVVAQGWEAGGHRGAFDPEADLCLGTMALVPQVADAVSIPVIAAGGIGDGRAIAAAFMLGAEGVQLGTAFVGAEESSANAAYRVMLGSPRAERTALTRVISGRPARGIENRFMAELRGREGEVPAYPNAYDAGKALAGAAAKAEDTEFGAMWAGQAARNCRFAPAAEILRDLWAEARARRAP